MIMPLELRPNCECCDRDLPPDSGVAYICTFECTFCADCATKTLGLVCPNCGGELVRRPTRPPEKLLSSPASTVRIVRDYLKSLRSECGRPRPQQCTTRHRSQLLQRLAPVHVAAPEDGRTPSESVATLNSVFKQGFTE